MSKPDSKPTKPASDSIESAAGFSVPTGSALKNPRLHIVLVAPEIPNNTGNIGRTCVTTGCKLHLVKPLGFDIDEKACRRAGLDYWPRLDLEEHESLDGYLQKHPPGARTWFLTTKATRTIFDAPISMGDHLVFGRESAGLPDSIHAGYPDQRVCVPLVVGERSLNLSTCVAIAVYESVRKMVGSGETVLDEDGRLIDP
ncbi:MAG: tRNA (cytidine(34)-2'-O)-methyltransferase [Phycisphaerales bacterium]|nr:tRNA (cytidine(34)-2'-O)-methyltransferase [Phycisphaerales bacterium]